MILYCLYYEVCYCSIHIRYTKHLWTLDYRKLAISTTVSFSMADIIWIQRCDVNQKAELSSIEYFMYQNPSVEVE